MAQDRIITLHAPVGGIVKRYAVQTQPPFTTINAVNVRPDSAGVPSSGTRTDYIRERLGTRPGLGKIFSQQLGSGAPVRLLTTLHWIESNAIRVRAIAISNGTLYEEEPVGTMALASTPGTFNSAKVLHATERNQILYIADHSDTTTESSGTYQPKKFSPLTSVVSNWTASDGTIPYGNPCICTWRDRIVLGGGTTSPHLISASRQGDPEDWDFSETDAGAAWTLSSADAGRMGDIVTALIPHSDDCLVIGCATSVWIMRGDPGFGGTIDNITRKFGIVDKGAWCQTPDGWVVFLSQDGLKAIPAGCGASGEPADLSRPKIPEELLCTDKSTTTVAMEYDIRDRGVHVFLTPNSAGSTASGHWWFDWDTRSFWKVTLASTSYEPFAIHERKYTTGQSAADSQVLLGCRDGYIRRHENDRVTDDSSSFSSEVWFGPFGDSTLINDTMIAGMFATLGKYGGKVRWDIYTGDSPEEAFNANSRENGIWEAGRNPWSHPRVRGQSMYLKLTNADSLGWAFESGAMRIAPQGKTRV